MHELCNKFMSFLEPNEELCQWKACPSDFEIEQIFLKGELAIIREDEVAIPIEAGLTQHEIILFDFQGKPQFSLALTWKMFEHYSVFDSEEPQHILCLHGLDNSQEFMVETEESHIIWTKELTRLCVNTYIENYYELSNELGSGTFSNVYLARNLTNGERFAIKAIKKSFLHDNFERTSGLRREISINRMLLHPNILKFNCLFEDDEDIDLIFDLCAHGNVRSLLRFGTKLPLKNAFQILQGLFNALTYVHSLSIVHRDIKADNLLISNRSDFTKVKLCDFGISDYLGESRLLSGRCGTLGYMAPELLRGDEYNEKVDIYSAGILMYQL